MAARYCPRIEMFIAFRTARRRVQLPSPLAQSSPLAFVAGDDSLTSCVRYHSTQSALRGNVENSNSTPGPLPTGIDGSGSSEQSDKPSIHKIGSQGEDIAEVVRSNMRHITYPVAIITSTDQIKKNVVDGLGTWRGATVSSFNTVSMNPDPIVSFNIHHKSTTLTAIMNSGYFAVHLLNRTPEARAIANMFSRGNSSAGFLDTESGKLRSWVYKGAWDTWNESASETHENLPPTLQWRHTGYARAVLSTLLCQSSQSMTTEMGDHVVVFGKVLHATQHKESDHFDESRGFLVTGDCLTYSKGEYNVGGLDEIHHLVKQTEAQRTIK